VPVPVASEPVGGTSWSPVKCKVKTSAIGPSFRVAVAGPAAE
jgi:hypothetical protein